MTAGVFERYGLEESYVPAIRPDSILRYYQNDGVAWSPLHPTPAYLDPVASVVVRILDGRATVGELVADVNDVMAVPKDIAAAQIARVLRQLRENALLVDSIAEPVESSLSIFHDPPNT